MGWMGMTAALALLAAAAATAGAAPPKKGEAGYDPNRQICKSRPVIGSRVARVRECHSAAEWEDLKLQVQVGMMRKQMNGDSGCNNDPYSQQCGVMNGGRDTPW
jgi:hypothetical protein